MPNQFSMNVPKVKGIDLDEIYKAQLSRQQQQMMMEEMADKRAGRNAMRSALAGMDGSQMTPEMLQQMGAKIAAYDPDKALSLIQAGAQMSDKRLTQGINKTKFQATLLGGVKDQATLDAAGRHYKAVTGEDPPEELRVYNPAVIDLYRSFLRSKAEQEYDKLRVDEIKSRMADRETDNARAAERFQWDKETRGVEAKSPYASVQITKDLMGEPTGAVGIDKRDGRLVKIPIEGTPSPGQPMPPQQTPTPQVSGTPVQISPQENFSADGYDQRVPSINFQGYRAKGGKVGNALRSKVNFCGGRAEGGYATKDLSQANSGGNALNMTVVGERGPEVVLLPAGSEGYVLPITDKHASELLQWGAPGRAEGGAAGDNDRDADAGDEGNDGGFHDDRDSGYDGGDGEGDTSGWGGKFSREGSGYGSGNVGDSSDNDYGGVKDGVLSNRFKGAYAAAPAVRAQGMTTTEAMDSMSPSQRAAYAANVEGLNESPFSAFGGDMQSDNTPQSRAGSMFKNALKQQVTQQQALSEEQQQAASLYGYQNGTPNYGALFAGDPKARLTSDYGVRSHPIDGVTKMHYGADIAAQPGSQVTTATNGTVTFSGWKNGYGNAVEVQDENGNTYTFGHLDSTNVKTGDTLSAGDIVGKQGKTGKATGDHLHYGVKDSKGNSVDPGAFHGWRS